MEESGKTKGLEKKPRTQIPAKTVVAEGICPSFRTRKLGDARRDTHSARAREVRVLAHTLRARTTRPAQREWGSESHGIGLRLSFFAGMRRAETSSSPPITRRILGARATMAVT